MRLFPIVLICLCPLAGNVRAGEWDISGSIGVEARGYVHGPQFMGQLDGVQVSTVLTSEIRYESDDGAHQISFVPFLRVDARDDGRTHYDVREAYWRYVSDDWEILTGLNTVFWGVTESRHLVDIINQKDAVEDIDGEDKLGQPMVHLTLYQDWGTVGLYVLPGFRERTFAGVDGRLRPPLPVADDGEVYEASTGDEHVDVALRYSHFFGNWDVGLHYFRGTDREPQFLLNPTGDGLIPKYNVINQGGIDVQFTADAWLWKLEGLVREGQGETFGAFVAGFEYTQYQIYNSATDLSFLAEYLHDDRDLAASPTALEDDIFVGTRLALNDVQDTQALIGAVIDIGDGSTALFIEAERRLGDSWTLELESRWFLGVDDANTLAPIQQDDFVTLRLSKFF